MKSLRCFSLLIILLVTGSVTSFAAEDKAKSAAAGNSTSKNIRFKATLGADGVQRVEVVGGEYFYDPNHIVVKVNRPVEIKFKKAPGYVPHNLVVNAPEAGMDIRVDMKGDPQTVKFTPTKIGKYPIYCDKTLLWFKSHREKGMEGMIEVVE